MPTEFINETPFKLVALPGRVGFPGHSLTLVAKGTFKLVVGGVATLAQEQAEFAGDVRYEGDESENGGPRAEADLIAPTKPKTDFVVVGQCHVPGARPLPQCQVSAALGAHVHHLIVFGNRQWLPDGRLLGPEPFTTMPLRYERSYGGPGFPENPVGVGFAPVIGPDGRSQHALPNIEDPRTPVTKPGAHTFPAGFGALSRAWRFRASKLGTYTADYVKTRWPGLPLDSDWTHYCAAHPALQIHPYATGDETLVFTNLHPEHSRLESKLPGLRMRGFLDIPKGEAIALHEVPMHLDTVSVDLESETLVMLWRGVVSVSSAKYPEVRRVYLVSEPLDAVPRPVGEHEVLLSRRLVEMAIEAEPPEPANNRLAALAAAMSVGAGGFGSTAALPTRAPKQAEAAEDEADDAAFNAQVAELEAALAGAAAMAKDLPDVETPDVEVQADEALTPEQRVAAAKEAVQQGRGLAGEDLSGLDFSRFDFLATNLDEALFTGSDLTGAKLDGCSCKGATFANAKLGNVSAVKADFSEAQMPGCHAQKANFTSGTFVNASLEGADLQTSVFAGATMQGAVFAEANVSSADFSEAKLNKANFVAAIATAANFSGAHLVDATFAECNATQARFADCNATKVRAAGADFTGATWQRCQAVEGVFSEAKLDHCNFSGAVLAGANFMGASLMGALFLAADCKGARFSEGNLSTSNLAQANLFEAIFEAANLTGASLRGCNAYGAEFLDAELANCDLTGTNLKRTKLEQGKVRP